MGWDDSRGGGLEGMVLGEDIQLCLWPAPAIKIQERLLGTNLSAYIDKIATTATGANLSAFIDNKTFYPM